CVVVVGILSVAKPVLMPLAMSVLLSFLLSPFVSALQRRGLGRALPIAIAVALVFVVLLGVGWVLMGQVGGLVAGPPRFKDNIKQKILDVRSIRENHVSGELKRTVDEIVGEIQGSDGSAPGEAKPVPVEVTSDKTSLLWRAPELIEPLSAVALMIFFTI